MERHKSNNDMTTEFLFRDLGDYWQHQKWYAKMLFPMMLAITIWSEFFEWCYWIMSEILCRRWMKKERWLPK